MFFSKKRPDEKRQMMDDISKMLEERPAPKPAAKMPEMQENWIDPRIESMPIPESAPLFVKVEKYKEMLTEVQDIKNFISGMKQLFIVMQDMENARLDAMNLMRATVQRIEKNITQLDAHLLRPKGIEMEYPKEEMEVKHIENSLSELQRQLGQLKRDLQEFK